MSIAVRLPELLLKYNSGSKMEQCPIVEVLLAHLRTLLGTTQKQPMDKSLLSSQRRLTNTGEVTNIGEPTSNSIISEYGASQVSHFSHSIHTEPVHYIILFPPIFITIECNKRKRPKGEALCDCARFKGKCNTTCFKSASK